MLLLRKILIYKVAMILLVLLTSLFVMGASSFNKEYYSSFNNEMKINNKIEDITNSLLPENNSQICVSSDETCGPPPGWDIN